jgi:hypothetical protein
MTNVVTEKQLTDKDHFQKGIHYFSSQILPMQ